MRESKLCERLSELRAAKGMTQEELAKCLEVSDKTISKWECGASEPSLAMLSAIADHFGVSTDRLLGRDEYDNPELNVIGSELRGLSRDEAILKVFELALSVPSAIYENTDICTGDPSGAVPELKASPRSKIATSDFYCFTVSSHDVNAAVMLLKNRADFAWLKERETQERISELFGFLSDPDVLSLMYFLNSTDCTKNFTADFAAKAVGISESKVTEILHTLCEISECRRFKAALEEGEVDIYRFHEDGLILSLVSLAFEHMCGKKSYSYNLSGFCRMIGEGGAKK